MNNELEVSFDFLFKIIIVGDSGVGKTNILNRYIEDKFMENNKNTLGVDFSMKDMEILDNHVKIQFWDTAGQERFKAMNNNYYKNVSGVIIVYDITDTRSFDSIIEYLKDIRENCDDYDNVKITIFGNKIDLEKDRKVNKQDVLHLLKNKNISHKEISAKSNTDNCVNNAIFKLLETIVDHNIKNVKNRHDSDIRRLKEKTLIKPITINKPQIEEKKKCC